MINYLKKEIKSFGYALRGIYTLFTSQNHAKIHLLAAFLVLGSGIFLDYSKIEWAILIITIGLVISAEGFNTAIEFLADRITGDYSELIKKAKDVAAGSVLILAFMAIIIAGLIILPKL